MVNIFALHINVDIRIDVERFILDRMQFADLKKSNYKGYQGIMKNCAILADVLITLGWLTKVVPTSAMLSL